MSLSTLEWIRKNYGDPMKVFSSMTRAMLIASPGKELFCADFAAIEARVAFWLSEHEEGLQAFREDRKLYEEMAAQAFDMDIEWLCTEEGKASLERFVGKESVLGCQYGMGWLKFKSQCHKKGMKSVTDEIAKKAVYTYRKIHWPVPLFWKNIEDAAVQAILNPKKSFKVTKVKIYMNGDFLNIRLPSGRRLRYYKPRVSQKQLANGRMVPQIHYWTMDHHQWCEVVTWGGILTNHCVQGIARDLMANGMLNIENAKYDFLVSVHDEAIAERKIGLGNLDEYISLMTTIPNWAAGVPITASGFVSKRYRK